MSQQTYFQLSELSSTIYSYFKMPLNLLNENRNMHLLACRLFALQFLEAPRRACMVHHSIYNHYAFLIPTPLYPTSAELLNPNKFSRISPFQKNKVLSRFWMLFPGRHLFFQGKISHQKLIASPRHGLNSGLRVQLLD